MYRIGIDVGGTFTDMVSVDDAGRVALAKAASTPGDPSLGVMDGIAALAAALGTPPARLLAETERIVHGTTVATNALLEQKGARVGLLTTEGHRDVIEMREGLKPDRYNLRVAAPEPLVPRARPLGARERLRADGGVAGGRGAGSPGPPGGGVLSARLPRRPPRGGHGRGAGPRLARRVRVPVLAGAAADQGVRARLDHGG